MIKTKTQLIKFNWTKMSCLLTLHTPQRDVFNNINGHLKLPKDVTTQKLDGDFDWSADFDFSAVP